MTNPPRPGPRDPAADDRAAAAGRTDLTLPELLGKAAVQEEERSALVWLAGLVAVLLFLGLIALVVSRLSPA